MFYAICGEARCWLLSFVMPSSVSSWSSWWMKFGHILVVLFELWWGEVRCSWQTVFIYGSMSSASSWSSWWIKFSHCQRVIWAAVRQGVLFMASWSYLRQPHFGVAFAENCLIFKVLSLCSLPLHSKNRENLVRRIPVLPLCENRLT